MIHYTVQSIGYEFHASRNEWNGQEWWPVETVVSMDPLKALEKLIAKERQ